MNNRKLVLLLAVPAVMMVCRGSARRAAWLEGMGADAGHPGHRRHFDPGRFDRAGFGGAGFGPWSRGAGAGAWRLPPVIEAKLDEWHRAAHATGGDAATGDTTV